MAFWYGNTPRRTIVRFGVSPTLKGNRIRKAVPKPNVHIDPAPIQHQPSLRSYLAASPDRAIIACSTYRTTNRSTCPKRFKPSRHLAWNSTRAGARVHSGILSSESWYRLAETTSLRQRRHWANNISISVSNHTSSSTRIFLQFLMSTSMISRVTYSNLMTGTPSLKFPFKIGLHPWQHRPGYRSSGYLSAK